MVDCKATQGPIANNFKLSSSQSPKSEAEKAEMNIVPYVGGVSSLMYVNVCTRTYLAYVVSLVSRFMGKLWNEH